MPDRIAAQLYTVRDFLITGKGLAESLRKTKAIGYDSVQFSAVGAVEGENPDTTPQQARRMLDDAGLVCIGTHRRWRALRDDTAAEIEYHKALGADFVAVPAFADEYDRFDPASYRRFVQEAEPVIQALKAEGIALGYHNHAHEFLRFGRERKTLFDILIEDGGPDLLLEVDVYWAAFAGVNPAWLMRRIHGRARFIHLKDMEVVLEADGARTKPIYAAVGEGNLDWDSIIPAAKSAGTEVWIVEQDVCPRDPFDCLRSSYEFLRSKI